MIKVAFLDDHHSIIDGYKYRLSQCPEIAVIGTMNYGDELLPFLANHEIDILILDVSVPTNRGNSNPYPILFSIPKILQRHQKIRIIIVSMHNQPSVVQATIEAGVSGYILKDDRSSILKLGEIINSVAEGGVYISQDITEIQPMISQSKHMITPRQLEALSVCASLPGATSTLLAERLGIAPSTLRNLLSSIYKNLGVANRTEAIIKARRLGLITPDEPGI